MNEYYAILGLKPGASFDEIKRAYRQKAKEYHPDVCKRPDAQEKFIQVSVAYEALAFKYSGKIYDEVKEEYMRPSKSSGAAWNDKKREEAKRRAQQYAKMQFEQFMKTKQYRTLVTLHSILDWGLFLLSISLFTVPLIGAGISGVRGFLSGLFILFILTPLIVNAFRNFRKRKDPRNYF